MKLLKRALIPHGSPFNGSAARSVRPYSKISRTPVNHHNGNQALSAREVQVLNLLVQGCYYREISDRLKISYATVHTHVRHIYKKFQVRSRGHAVARFLINRAAQEII
jgi:DNA-binding CsgD family transcriptional regulator